MLPPHPPRPRPAKTPVVKFKPAVTGTQGAGKSERRNLKGALKILAREPVVSPVKSAKAGARGC